MEFPKVNVSGNKKIYIIHNRNKIYLTKYTAIKLLCQILIILWYAQMLPNTIIGILKYTINKYPKLKNNFTCKVYKNNQQSIHIKLQRMILDMDSMFYITKRLIYLLFIEFKVYTQKQVDLVINAKPPKKCSFIHDWTNFFVLKQLCTMFKNERLFVHLSGY